uniref:Uncharacterized protein n=1 Tax=Panagrolaimus sp. ES5 TaxID=591445 RepID=A0AC34FXT5_9BILA
MASQSGGPASGEINLSTTRVPPLQSLIDPATMAAAVTNSTSSTSDGGGGGLSGGAIAGIVIATMAAAVTNSTSSTSDGGGGGLSGGAIAGIVIGVIVGVIIIAIVIFLIIRKVRDQRKNHGEYRPQLEENLHAKDLPYLPPPNIEGHLG